MRRRTTRKMMAEINVVPFIDVMLVLLVIFMITTPLLTQGVKVDLPKTDAKALAEAHKEPLIITVDESGKLYFNLAEKPNIPLNEHTLVSLVQDQLGTNPSLNTRPVLVRGDKNANYGQIMSAMILLQKAGAKSVGLITDPLGK